MPRRAVGGAPFYALTTPALFFLLPQTVPPTLLSTQLVATEGSYSIGERILAKRGHKSAYKTVMYEGRVMKAEVRCVQAH